MAVNSQNLEIRRAVCADLSELADRHFFPANFTRRENSLKYLRKLGLCQQQVEVAIDYSSLGNQLASAAIDPILSVRVQEVDKIATQMTSGNESLLDPTQATLRQPIGFLSGGGRDARWYIYQRNSVRDAVVGFVQYSKVRVIPFLNAYASAQDIVALHESGDDRVTHEREYFLRVVAAYLHLGFPQKAYEVLNTHFGRPLNRRIYASVYRFVEQRLGEDRG